MKQRLKRTLKALNYFKDCLIWSVTRTIKIFAPRMFKRF